MRIALTEFTEWCLEIVGLHRQVVVVRSYGALHLVQVFSFRLALSQAFCPTHGVCASVIHVVAQEVAAATQFHECHGVGILGIEIHATMVARHHTATQFAGEVRVLLFVGVGFGVGIVNLFGGDGIGDALPFEVKRLPVAASGFFNAALPEAIGIVAIKRKHLTKRNGCGKFGPSCACVERQVVTDAQGDAFECHQVTSSASVLVVELACHQGAIIFPLQSLNLGEDLSIEPFHKT